MCVHCTIMLFFWEGLLGYSLAPPATLAAPLCYPKLRVANSFNSKQLLCPEALIPCRSNILLAMFFYCPTLDFVLDMDNRKLSLPPNCGQKEAILFWCIWYVCRIIQLCTLYIFRLHWIVMCRSGQLFSKHLCGAAVCAAGWGEAHPASICSCLSSLSFFSTSSSSSTCSSSISSSSSCAAHIEAELGREGIHPAAQPYRSTSFPHHSTSDETWKPQGRNTHKMRLQMAWKGEMNPNEWKVMFLTYVSSGHWSFMICVRVWVWYLWW